MNTSIDHYRKGRTTAAHSTINITFPGGDHITNNWINSSFCELCPLFALIHPEQVHRLLLFSAEEQATICQSFTFFGLAHIIGIMKSRLYRLVTISHLIWDTRVVCCTLPPPGIVFLASQAQDVVDRWSVRANERVDLWLLSVMWTRCDFVWSHNETQYDPLLHMFWGNFFWPCRCRRHSCLVVPLLLNGNRSILIEPQ